MPYFKELREKNKSSFYNKLWSELEDVKVYSTHEHLKNPSEWKKLHEETGVLFPHVFQSCYVPGLNKKPGNHDDWAAKLDKMKHTAYLKSLLWAFEDLYGLSPPINREYLDTLEKKLVEVYVQNDGMQHVKDVLEKKMHVETAILDVGLDNHLEMQEKIPAIKAAAGLPTILNGIRVPRKVSESVPIPYKFAVEHLGMNLEDIKSLDDYCMVVEKLLEYWRDSKNYMCYKIQSAYERPLSFPDPDPDEEKIIRSFNKPRYSENELWRFGDYMLHYILEWAAINWRKPFQFHTGLARMLYGDSNAINMSFLFQKFPDIEFDLFHGNYPYNNLAGMLHQIKNVHADLCWLPIISPTAAKRTLKELIEVGDMVSVIEYHAPMLRTSLFGGDCQAVEGSHGALLMAKDVLIQALEELYYDGLVQSIPDAIDLAKNLLYENPKRLFG
ncbi:MAG: hypothetical protein ACTSXU_00980 [Promethearchaeota archaeon]